MQTIGERIFIDGNDDAEFDRLFPRDRIVIFWDSHGDEAAIMVPSLIRLLKDSGRTLGIINPILDALGVSDEYLSEYCTKKAKELPNEEARRRVYKKGIRAEETLNFFSQLGLKVDILGIDWPLVVPKTRISSRGEEYVDADSSTFTAPTPEDQAKIEDVIQRHHNAIHILYPPTAAHPHHAQCSQLICQALKKFGVEQKYVFFFRSPHDQNDQNIAKQIIFRFPESWYVKSGAMLTAAYISQDHRHKIHFNGCRGFYANYSRQIAENRYKEIFPKHQEIGYAEDLIQLTNF